MDDRLYVTVYPMQHFRHALDAAQQLAEDARDLGLTKTARKFDLVASSLEALLKDIHDDRVSTAYIEERGK